MEVFYIQAMTTCGCDLFGKTVFAGGQCEVISLAVGWQSSITGIHMERGHVDTETGMHTGSMPSEGTGREWCELVKQRWPQTPRGQDETHTLWFSSVVL